MCAIIQGRGQGVSVYSLTESGRQKFYIHEIITLSSGWKWEYEGRRGADCYSRLLSIMLSISSDGQPEYTCPAKHQRRMLARCRLPRKDCQIAECD